MVKVYLSRQDIPFTERNVSLDREALKTLVTMGYRTTPVTVIGEQKIVGFSPSKMQSALQAEGFSG
jgi:glutaredoxin